MSTHLATPESLAAIAHTGTAAPWGRLAHYETYLEAPDALLRMLPVPSEQAVWHFMRQSAEAVEKILDEAHLDATQLATLKDRRYWSLDGAGLRIFPRTSVVESLSPRSRTHIYHILSQWEENPSHRHPLTFDRTDLNRILEGKELSKDARESLRQLVYTDGGVCLFSDLPALMRHAQNPREERKLMRILTRTRTLLAELMIDGNSKLEEIAHYWTLSGRQTDALPLLESITRTRGVESLDIVHLLPTGPRSQLYTYPSIEDVLDGRAPDSIWTALNFFNKTPVPIYLDSPNLESSVHCGFDAVKPPLKFGDVIFLSPKSTKRVCHACVYLAGDIVFTKTSAGFFSPWILSRLQDVLAYHVRESEAVISPWRKR